MTIAVSIAIHLSNTILFHFVAQEQWVRAPPILPDFPEQSNYPDTKVPTTYDYRWYQMFLYIFKNSVGTFIHLFIK